VAPVTWLDDLSKRLAREPELSPERVVELIAREWGGQRVYVPRRVGRPEILPTDTPATVQRRYGVPRSTAHAWVQRWRR
jgi:hypothetical protein